MFNICDCAAKYIFLVQGREWELGMYSLFLELECDFFPVPYAF